MISDSISLSFFPTIYHRHKIIAWCSSIVNDATDPLHIKLFHRILSWHIDDLDVVIRLVFNPTGRSVPSRNHHHDLFLFPLKFLSEFLDHQAEHFSI